MKTLGSRTAFAAATTSAQYPQRPVGHRAWGAGGTDATARIIATLLERS